MGKSILEWFKENPGKPYEPPTIEEFREVLGNLFFKDKEMVDEQGFLNKYSIEEIDRKSNGAPLYKIVSNIGAVEFTGTLPECVAYLHIWMWKLDGHLEIKGRDI